MHKVSSKIQFRDWTYRFVSNLISLGSLKEACNLIKINEEREFPFTPDLQAGKRKKHP